MLKHLVKLSKGGSKLKKIISGNLVYLRNLTIKDIDNGWLEWINRKDIVKFMPYVNKCNRNDLVDYLKNNKLPKSKVFAVCLLNNKYIGNARISSIDKKNGTAIYGRLIGEESSHGKGIGTEVLNLLAVYAFDFLKLRKIYCGVLAKNIGSVKSNLKAGAKKEGTLKKHVLFKKKYEDVDLYSIFKSNYKRKK